MIMSSGLCGHRAQHPTLGPQRHRRLAPGQAAGSAGRVVIVGALVLGVVLLIVGFAAAAVTCAVTAGVLWLLLQIPDEPENGDALRPPVFPGRTSTDAIVPSERLGGSTCAPIESKGGAPGSARQRTHHGNRAADASDASCLLSAAGNVDRLEHRKVGLQVRARIGRSVSTHSHSAAGRSAVGTLE